MSDYEGAWARNFWVYLQDKSLSATTAVDLDKPAIL